MGANVTMPHKETVVAHLDQLSGDAISVGAVNTIQRVGDQLIGHNTDVDGFKKFLVADAGLDVRGSRVLVLGSGGAARAVVRACDELEATQIVLAARNDLRAADIARTVQGAEAGAVAWSEATDVVAKVDMIVNATPVQSDELLPGAVFLGHHAVVDLVYGSANSSLVERARVAGAGAWSGLGMLVHQAAASFRIWTGQDPPLETMSAAALHALSTSG
jgi:shikimate dehydrogenase